jgi:uncharacterized protein
MTVFYTIALLFGSNLFMTIAWYGHLHFTERPLWLAILASWCLALFEYCLQVPANRMGYLSLTGYQLKTIQEVITLTVFILFAYVYLGEQLRPKHVVGFALLMGAAWVIFQDRFALEW